jgi:hypothetical protein
MFNFADVIANLNSALAAITAIPNTTDVIARIVPVLTAFSAVTYAVGAFRLNSLNNFVDNRKNAIRTVFRELVEAFPEFSLIIHNLGKSNRLSDEIEIFAAIDPSLGLYVKEIHELRKRYKKLKNSLVILVAILFFSSLFLVLLAYPNAKFIILFVAILIGLGIFFLNNVLGLKNDNSTSDKILNEYINKLLVEKDNIAHVSQARRERARGI